MNRTTRSLIDQLVADARAVRRVSAPRWTVLLLVMTVTLIFAILIPKFGLRPDLAQALRRPLDFLGIVGLFFLASACLALAVRESLPGRRRSRGLVLTLRIGLAVAAVGLAAGFWGPQGLSDHWRIGSDAVGIKCAVLVIALSVLPILGMMAALKKLAPMQPAKAAALAGLAAAALAALGVGLHCPIDEPIHWLLWHLTPIAVFASLVGMIGARWLRW